MPGQKYIALLTSDRQQSEAPLVTMHGVRKGRGGEGMANA